jgi:hypothetical protein
VSGLENKNVILLTKERRRKMSYCRNPYYIWPSNNAVYFEDRRIDNDEIDVWLYKMFLKNREKELIKRLKNGKQLCIDTPSYNYEYETDYLKNLMSE